ncbi:MAG TPA: sigma-70 family RNA polymerase sigma factor [Gammaproteobacteria bacterium]
MSSRGTARVAATDETEELEPDGQSADGRGVGPWRFRLAVVRHHRLVYRVAYSLLRDRHEAEDAAQETFLRFWECGGPVRGEREWLLAVVRNACLDRLRRTRRAAGDGGVPPGDEPRDERDPGWHAQHDEVAARLRERIAALPEPQRSLVILFDVHGLDGAACGRILGLNANQVKVYLHRARRRLRRELEGSL